MTIATNIKRFIRPSAVGLKRLFGLNALESNLSMHEAEMMPRTHSALCIDRFSSLLPYSHFDSETGLCAISTDTFNDFEGLGYVIEITPQTGANEVMSRSMMQLFGHGVPDGTGIQTSLFASAYIEPLANLIRDSAALSNENDCPQRAQQLKIIHGVSDSRTQFLKNGAIRNPFAHLPTRIRNFRSWISVIVPTKNPFDEAERHKVLRLRNSHLAILKQWHLAPWVWDESVLINTLSQILNPHRFLSEQWKPVQIDAMREPRTQCINPDTRIDIEPTAIRFSSYDTEQSVCAVAMSVRGYPESFTLPMVSELLGSTKGRGAMYPCPFLITSVVSVPNYEASKARTQLKSARAEQIASTEIAKLLPVLRQEAQDWQLAVESYENGGGLVQMSHQLLLFPAEQDRFSAVESARAIYAGAKLDLSLDDYMQLQGLMASLPMTAGPLLSADLKLSQRCTTKTAANAANMLPILADWKGSPPMAGHDTPTPIVNLVSRRGQLLSVNPFANPSGNYNGSVIGASGSGKSVLLNELANGVYRTGGRVWIIDNGRSFEKSCRIVGGQYIEFSDTPHADGSFDCLNPFSIITNFEKDLPLLLPVIAQMVSPSSPLSDLQLSHLAIHFKDVWERSQREKRTATVTDLAESLIHNGRLGGSKPRIGDVQWEEYYDLLTPQEQHRHNDQRISDLGVQLQPFCKGGAYESFFEGEANIRFDNKFIVLELEQLKTKKSLQSVFLMLLMCLIDLEMRQGSRTEPKLVIIDEAWDLLGDGHAGRFIEEGYRRARKYKGSFFTATQSPFDYLKSSAARAAYENSDCIFILRQKEDVLKQLELSQDFPMDEQQVSMLRTLSTVAGTYSEVFVRIGDQPASINRLMLDPYSLLMVSTLPQDIQAINHYRNLGLDTHDAIESVLKDRGHSTLSERSYEEN